MSRVETLFYFKGQETKAGYIPAHYHLATSRKEERECLEAGGIVGNEVDWDEYNMQRYIEGCISF